MPYPSSPSINTSAVCGGTWTSNYTPGSGESSADPLTVRESFPAGKLAKETSGGCFVCLMGKLWSIKSARSGMVEALSAPPIPFLYQNQVAR